MTTLIPNYQLMPHSFDYPLIQHAESLGHGEIHIKFDAATGLRAIVAIHSTKHGPALGGTRLFEYDHAEDGLYDAMRLARAMTYKAAITKLPLGGGKAVLLKPKKIKDHVAYFKAYGRFVNDLGGRYITATDVGTSTEDMDTISEVTPYVSCLTSTHGNNEASHYTAYGVSRGIEAAVKFKLKRDSLDGIHVAIQGVGHVGYFLIEELSKQGVTFTVSDINSSAIKHVTDKFKVNVVSPEDIYKVKCDVFSPCALGETINDDTIPLLNTSIIAGSANNQLIDPKYGDALLKQGILYAPDYLINSGGLVFAYTQYYKKSRDVADQHIAHLYDSLIEIFTRAEREHKSTSDVADKIAQQILDGDLA